MIDPVDWARVYDYQRDGGLESRLQIWIDIQHRQGRQVVQRRFGGHEFIRLLDGTVDDVTNQSGPPPGSWYLAFADPTIHEPTDDPDDDLEAEVPDAREDPVPE